LICVGADTACSMGLSIRKRWPSGETSRGHRWGRLDLGFPFFRAPLFNLPMAAVRIGARPRCAVNIDKAFTNDCERVTVG
jgi:hypothetical protein